MCQDVIFNDSNEKEGLVLGEEGDRVLDDVLLDVRVHGGNPS